MVSHVHDVQRALPYLANTGPVPCCAEHVAGGDPAWTLWPDRASYLFALDLVAVTFSVPFLSWWVSPFLLPFLLRYCSRRKRSAICGCHLFLRHSKATDSVTPMLTPIAIAKTNAITTRPG